MIGLVTWLSRGSLRPKDYEQKEYWTWRPAGEKPIIIRFFSRRGRWGPDDDDDNPQDDDEVPTSVPAAKDAHLGLDGSESTASLGRASAPGGGGGGGGGVRSVASRSVASRGGSAGGGGGGDDDKEQIRRPPTPGPLRTLH